MINDSEKKYCVLLANFRLPNEKTLQFGPIRQSLAF